MVILSNDIFLSEPPPWARSKEHLVTSSLSILRGGAQKRTAEKSGVIHDTKTNIRAMTMIPPPGDCWRRFRVFISANNRLAGQVLLVPFLTAPN